MPIKPDAILSYVNGRKYKSFLEKNIINNQDLKKYSEFLVPSNKPNRKLDFFFNLK